MTFRGDKLPTSSSFYFSKCVGRLTEYCDGGCTPRRSGEGGRERRNRSSVGDKEIEDRVRGVQVSVGHLSRKTLIRSVTGTEVKASFGVLGNYSGLGRIPMS